MEKVNFFIGLNDKDTKRQIIDTLEASKMVTNLCVEMFGGATIYNAVGVYKHDNGVVVTENTLHVVLFDSDKEKIDRFISMVKIMLNQESLVMQIETVNSSYV